MKTERTCEEAAELRQTVKRCSRCAGTGLVCGHAPVVGPNNCCVDFANAICPECNGSGVIKPASEIEGGH